MTDAQPDRPIRCRGVRGAITVEANTAEAIVGATREMLEALIAANGIEPDDVCSLLLTTTPDLTAEYPAVAARQIGWQAVAVMCAHEMAVPHGLPRCIRALLHLEFAADESLPDEYRWHRFTPLATLPTA